MTMTFGSALRWLRKRKGLTLQQVAEGMGVTYPSVQQWETDKTLPQLTRISDLGKILGANLAGLWPGQSEDQPLEYSEDLLRLCIEEHEETRRYEDEAVKLGRYPFYYATNAREIARIKEHISHFVRDKKDPNLNDVIKIYKTNTIDGKSHFEIASDPAGYVTKPRSLSIMKMPFGIYMPNSAMSPRYEKGELLVFDDVPLVDCLGYALIGRLDRERRSFLDAKVLKIVSISEKEFGALQLNPLEHVVVPRTTDTQAHRVLSTMDVLQDVTPAELKGLLR